jgi:hypothetical protein
MILRCEFDFPAHRGVAELRQLVEEQDAVMPQCWGMSPEGVRPYSVSGLAARSERGWNHVQPHAHRRFIREIGLR